MADNLSRKDSATSFIGPKPADKISGNLIDSIVNNILWKKNSAQHDTKSQRQAKELNHGCSSVRHKKLIKLNGNAIRKVIGLFTEHCRLRRHFTVTAKIIQSAAKLFEHLR